MAVEREAGDRPAGPESGVPDAAGPDRLAAPAARTGEPRVDAALGRLDELADRPVSEHPAVFEHVHARLSEVLGELDSGPAAGRPGQAGD